MAKKKGQMPPKHALGHKISLARGQAWQLLLCYLPVGATSYQVKLSKLFTGATDFYITLAVRDAQMSQCPANPFRWCNSQYEFILYGWLQEEDRGQ